MATVTSELDFLIFAIFLTIPFVFCAVFMKDMSKQTIEDLITFIYCGEVKVPHKNVDDFLKTAKVLKIKGLADGRYENAFDSLASTSTWSAPAYNRLQYQSSQTVQVPKLANYNLADSSDDAFQIQDDFIYGNTNSMSGNGPEMDINPNNDFNSYDLGNEDSVMDLALDEQNYQWNADSKNDFDETPPTANILQVKRSKRNMGKHSWIFL